MTESQLQQQIIIYFRNNCKGFIFAVPNGGTRNLLEAKNLKATGLVAGVSDLIVLLPNKCVFVEVKIEKGIQSDKQKYFETTVKNLGFDYFIVRSLTDFINIL